AQRHSLWRASYDPDRTAIVENPVVILEGSLGISDISSAPDAQTVAFSSKGTAAPEDIYTIGRDGRGLRQLTSDPERDRGPSWLPDKSRVLFYSTRGGRLSPWSMNPDGSDLRPIAPADDVGWQFPRPAPGNRIMVTANDETALLDVSVTPSKILEVLPSSRPAGLAQFFP